MISYMDDMISYIDGVKVNGVEIRGGDGLFINNTEKIIIESTGDRQAEFVLFDLKEKS